MLLPRLTSIEQRRPKRVPMVLMLVEVNLIPHGIVEQHRIEARDQLASLLDVRELDRESIWGGPIVPVPMRKEVRLYRFTGVCRIILM